MGHIHRDYSQIKMEFLINTCNICKAQRINPLKIKTNFHNLMIIRHYTGLPVEDEIPI